MATEGRIPMKAPVIPITETVIFPGIKNRIYVNETIGNNIKQYMGDANTLAVGLTTKGNIPYEELNDSSFYRIGVLFPLYGCVKAAFLGGSIAPRGGQNIMEPAIWGIPFCQGPDYRDFTEATDGLVAAGLCEIVHDAEEMSTFFGRKRESITYREGDEN